MSKSYPQDLRDRAVRLALETKDQYPSEHAAIKSIAAKLGIGTTQTLTSWDVEDLCGLIYCQAVVHGASPFNSAEE